VGASQHVFPRSWGGTRLSLERLGECLLNRLTALPLAERQQVEQVLGVLLLSGLSCAAPSNSLKRLALLPRRVLQQPYPAAV
jgi:hypothetical protein